MAAAEQHDVEQVMLALGRDAKAAAPALATSNDDTRNKALRGAAAALRARTAAILEANETDVVAAKARGLSAAMVDRLQLDAKRVEGIAAGLEAIANLADPIGKVDKEWMMPGDETGAIHNPGLHFERVRVPLGLIGVIYESRPNVTADAAGLCIKSGNAVILRGGSESKHSSAAIHSCVAEGLTAAGLDPRCVALVPTTDRAAVGHMLTGLGGKVDVVIPRGGKSLVERVQREARVPVFSHLEGICHCYVDASANVDAAVAVVTNAKMRRTGVCGATETVLIDTAALATHLAPLVASLAAKGCEIRGDAAVREAAQGAAATIVPATDEDWSTEYLAPVVSIAAVEGVKGAIAHIARYSSSHTESVLATDPAVVGAFFAGVDSAIVLHNASTQFADGGEFGFGAEIGIATGKMHARGPVGVEQLTTFKYLVRSRGDYSLRK